MLIEFSVKNFRSFKDKQTLSLVADNFDKSITNNLVKVNAPGLANIKLHKCVLILGANASGKSNLMKSLGFLRNFIVTSATELKPGDEIEVSPFKLDKNSLNESSEFEIIFIHENVRYQYGIILNKVRIMEEWLFAYPSKQAQKWFCRKWISSKKGYQWKFSQYLKGEKTSLKNKTRENNSFISVAAQFNHEKLSHVYNWFHTYLRFLDCSLGQYNSTRFTSLLLKNKEHKEKIVSMLRAADLGISNILVKEEEPNDFIIYGNVPGDIKDKVVNNLKSELMIKFSFVHELRNKEQVIFDKDEESAGTLKYFSLIGPWIDILSHGYVAAIDEIGAMIHPLLLRDLIQQFMCGERTSKNAQLLLTTHDVTLLDPGLLRRDQVWFVEKNVDGASLLFPLTDYKPRKNESLQKGYLAGRYGAIPFLPEGINKK